MPKIKLSDKMAERMLAIMKEEGGEQSEARELRQAKKKPGPKARSKATGVSVGKFKAVPSKLAAPGPKKSPNWQSSYIWVIEKPFVDDAGVTRWEFLSAHSADNAVDAIHFVTPACRKRKCAVYGIESQKDKQLEEKEDAEQLKLEIDTTGSSPEST